MKIVFLIVVAVVLALIVTRFQGNQYKAFIAGAKQVQATVTLRTERDSGQKNHRKEHVVGYRFSVDGKNYNGEDNVEFADLWPEVKEGDLISVYYDPANPSRNYPVILLDRRVGVADTLARLWLK